MSHLNRTQSLAQLGLSVSRIKVEDLDEQRLDQLRVDLQKELNVRLVELRMKNMYAKTKNSMYELLWNNFNLFEQINDIYCVKLA